METLEGRRMVALILFAGSLVAVLGIHVLVELTSIRGEIRRLRQQVRRLTNPGDERRDSQTGRRDRPTDL